MIVEIFGWLFVVFVPGYLVTRLFFKDTVLETVVLSLCFSIMISFLVFVFLHFSFGIGRVSYIMTLFLLIMTFALGNYIISRK